MADRKPRSRKPFAANSVSTPPSLVLFTDHCLGKQVPEALRAAGAQVVMHTERFPQDMSDVDLLTAIGRLDWVFLSKDKKIRKRPLEIGRLMEARVRAFYLTSGNLRGSEQAGVFVRALRRIVRMCERPGPFIVRITATGSMEEIAGPSANRSANRLRRTRAHSGGRRRQKP